MSGLEKIKLTSEQWIDAVKNDHEFNLPIRIQVISNSMYPWIRAKRDSVMIVPARAENLRNGDIVMFSTSCTDVDFILHRIHKIDGDRVLTMGDANRVPDGWIDKAEILGKAIMIQRDGVTIHCEATKWKILFRIWTSLWRVRPLMMFMVRVLCKINRLLQRKK